jgi:hypothetical protein
MLIGGAGALRKSVPSDSGGGARRPFLEDIQTGI